MAGLGIRLFTDEMISAILATALHSRGYDAESCQGVGRHNVGIPDPEQLAYAARSGRAIVTFNARDYAPLDRQHKAAGRQHGGIILSPQINDVGELLRCVQRHLDTVEPAVQDNTLLWLDTSPVD